MAMPSDASPEVSGLNDIGLSNTISHPDFSEIDFIYGNCVNNVYLMLLLEKSVLFSQLFQNHIQLTSLYVNYF